MGAYLFALNGASTTVFYAVCFMIGYTGGFWALFVTVAAEQFGTNLRSTVATTAPNFARGATVLIAPTYKALKAMPELGMVGAAGLIGAVLLLLAFFSASTLPETYAKRPRLRGRISGGNGGSFTRRQLPGGGCRFGVWGAGSQWLKPGVSFLLNWCRFAQQVLFHQKRWPAGKLVR